jgi:lipopolysaccharide export system ATP-binding protein
MGLRHAYSGRQVLHGLDIRVLPGEIVGILGPNGAGKSTCFRAIAGLIRPIAGTVRLGGVCLDRLPLWRRVRAGLGYLAQEPAIFRSLSTRDNLRVAVEGVGGNPLIVDALLDKAGLLPLAEASAGTLSGGERRRLELARTLATGPRVLLLDEPFAGVDPLGVADLKARILALAGAGLGVLLTDHAVHDALPLCTWAILIESGEVLVQGTPSELAQDPLARARYLGPAFRLQ